MVWWMRYCTRSTHQAQTVLTGFQQYSSVIFVKSRRRKTAVVGLLLYRGDHLVDLKDQNAVSIVFCIKRARDLQL
ncbi:MAG: hypothetical protein J07HN4v3_01478 [Halonotius sp. J07HN4]|nr:MAG: hypothetical protein J07HN4v3_01478 [Halonotius sp. J07HN4]